MVYPLHLRRDVDILRTVMHALVATDTMVRLTQARYAAVVTHEEGPPGFPVVFVLRRGGHITLVDTLVVMGEDARNVQPVGTRHAILAGRTRYRRIFQHRLRRIFEQGKFLVRAHIERGEGADIVLQMLHVGHTAQYGQHTGKRGGETECPRSDALLRTALFQACVQIVRQSGKAAAQ